MNYATFAALNKYDTATAAIAANGTNGDAWLLNETLVARDGTMPDSGPAAQLKSNQIMKASTVNPTVRRNKGNDGVVTANIGGVAHTFNTAVGGSRQSSLGQITTLNTNKETVANTKTPAIRHKVSWYVTDSTLSAGYRRVFGLLEDPSTTSIYRDDDAQVRK